ncbi:sigma factor-like helix-turn-helix DNA-binding protein [uncultured Duncaniella sp.]|uniref:RNA polymerase sigma factor n=1 Tax=uncultured Duncaniella sp. TaxID=2768039 RepID=UPI00339D7787
MSPQARRVMEFRFSEGLPFSRIAASMGISETAVYRHLSHALTIIRKKLKENG